MSTKTILRCTPLNIAIKHRYNCISPFTFISGKLSKRTIFSGETCKLHGWDIFIFNSAEHEIFPAHKC